jgi:hypothetical protein
VGAGLVDVADQRPGVAVDDADRRAAGDRRSTSADGRRREVQYQRPPRAAAAPLRRRRRAASGAGRAEPPRRLVGQRRLLAGAPQVGAEQVGVGRVDDGVLGRAVEQLVGVGDEVVVERILLRDEHPAAAPPERPARPSRCQNDAKVPGHPASTTASSPATSIPSSSALVAATPRRRPGPQVAPRGRVVPRRGSRPGRRRPCRRAGGRRRRSRRRAAPRDQRGHLGALAAAGEHQGLHVRGDERGQQVAGLAQQRPPGEAPRARPRPAARRRTGAATARRRAARAASRRGELGDLQPGDVLACSPGLPMVARGQQERRVGAVPLGEPAQPPQHQRDVPAEHAAGHVRLVDDHERQPVEQVAHRAVVGQQAVVQQVRVGQHPVGGPADRVALGWSGCPRRRGGAQLRQPPGAERPQLVVGERLGRGEVERDRLVVGEEPLERPGAGSRATCPTRCRWRRRGARRRGPAPGLAWCDHSWADPGVLEPPAQRERAGRRAAATGVGRSCGEPFEVDQPLVGGLLGRRPPRSIGPTSSPRPTLAGGPGRRGAPSSSRTSRGSEVASDRRGRLATDGTDAGPYPASGSVRPSTPPATDRRRTPWSC